ncbi:hypothetical protein [Streptomyces platensis]|uniref:hypothetical protein n=1 Tax=Streptomyces platensis TaxID=58346 RepID=UPI0033284D2E
MYTDDPGEIAALQAYWRLAEDGESWIQTVAAVRQDHGLKPQDMTRLVNEHATACITDITCTDCHEPLPVANRTNFADVIRRGNTQCGTCWAFAESRRHLEEQEQAARIRAEIDRRFPVVQTEPLDVAETSLLQAVGLHAMFSDPAVEDQGLSTPTNIWPKERPWAPSSLRWEYERRLMHDGDQSVVRSHPASHPDAFVAEDGEITGSFYLGKISYYMLGPDTDPKEHIAPVLSELNRIFREGPWPKPWLNQWRDLWNELALADAQAYLDMKLAEHHLEMKQGDGTRTALADALATFSLGQVFNFIYRATKDSAAYYQRGGVNKRQAANSTVGRISASADRARANGWETKSFGRPWNLPLSATGEVFFNKVMWQADMMQVAIDAASPPLHAWPNKHSDEPEGDQG